MDAKQRRNDIKTIIERDNQPVSASFLSKQFNVSRQVIVGDVALLRAEGLNIISTSRGYMSGEPPTSDRYVGKMACRHTQQETRDELYTIVDMGGHVLDVIIEHNYYGEITGQLRLSCRKDVDLFMNHIEGDEYLLLSELTKGVHLHTISCPDENVFYQIKMELADQGFLYPEK